MRKLSLGENATSRRRTSLPRCDSTARSHPELTHPSFRRPPISTQPPSDTARREFLELKERYRTAVVEGDGAVLDICEPARQAGDAFVSKLEARRRRGESAETSGGDDLARANAVLDAVAWIEEALASVDWNALRRDELSSEQLCDAAYALGNVVRLWKECAPVIESLMASDRALAIRRRDDFLKVLSQAKHLKYPDRSAYPALDERTRRAMSETGEHTDFLTWLPDECWGDEGVPPPPEPSARCRREQYAELAATWQRIQANFFMARLESELYDDIVPGLLEGVTNEDELAHKLRLARSILLSGKSSRCATIGRYQDFDAEL